MTFLDLFAGIGGFRRGLELAGHQCVGFCEWDKYATASYTAMHLLTDEQQEKLAAMPLKQRQKEILKEEYRNGEWYASDIRDIHAGTMPKADCWCFGAPCQDFSVAGSRSGMAGERSSLVREVFRLLREAEERDRPEWLIYENVKGILSSNSGLDYLSILLEMEGLGYDVEWQIFNSKDWGVPQNRERVYTVGHLRAKGGQKIFPFPGEDGANQSEARLILMNETSSDTGGIRVPPIWERVYDTAGLSCTITASQNRQPNYAVSCQIEQSGNRGSAAPIARTSNSQDGKCYGCGQVSQCLSAGHGNCPKVALPVGNVNPSGHGISGNVWCVEGLCPTLTTNHGAGNNVCIPLGCIDPQGRKEDSVILCDTVPTLRAQAHGNEPEIVMPVLNPDKEESRQNGRRLKDAGDPAFTLTAQDRHGIAISVDDTYGSGVEVGIREAADASHPGLFVRLENDLVVYAIWYEKYRCYIVIRKLTPRECFRLQGWSDGYFDRAAFVNTDSQLYKQAGNGVTVTVVYAIGCALKEISNNDANGVGKDVRCQTM